MKAFILGVFVSFAIVAVVYCLKCYECSGSEDHCAKEKLEADKKNMLTTCDPSLDICMRTWDKKEGKTLVKNSCNFKSVCDKNKKLCDDSSDGDCAVGCCDTDACNAGSYATFSTFVMAVCSALGLALLK